MITTAQVVSWINDLKDKYSENKEFLTRLDSDIGDGDHGINMDRGFTAAAEAITATPPADVGAAFKTVSTTLIKTVGGASGPLYGTLFLRAAIVFAGKTEISLAEFTEGIEKGIQGIEQLGKAQLGDKTMLDAWLPALDALKASDNIPTGIKSAADAAEEGVKNTIPLVAKKGRASYLGERSAGHQDPGATSTAIMLKSAAEFFTS